MFCRGLIVSSMTAWLCMGSFAAIDRHYVVPPNVNTWTVETPSRLTCHLSQDIPYYGKAVFSQDNAGNPTFQLWSWQGLSEIGYADMYFAAPAWRPYENNQKVGKVALQKGKAIIHLESKLAEDMMGALQIGLAPTFSYLANGSGVAVILSPLDFRTAYNNYLNCVGHLLEFKFEEIANNTTHFDFNGSTLPQPLKAQLDRIKEYLAADPSVKFVRINGYSDSLGRRGINNFISERRAKAVAKYLASHGVPKEKIKVNWYGSKKPIAENETEAGRVQNRRVTIQLERD